MINYNGSTLELIYMSALTNTTIVRQSKEINHAINKTFLFISSLCAMNCFIEMWTISHLMNSTEGERLPATYLHCSKCSLVLNWIENIYFNVQDTSYEILKYNSCIYMDWNCIS